MSVTLIEAPKLTGKVAIVTGGSSGLGRSVAQLFIANGAKVVIVDRASSNSVEGADYRQLDVSDAGAVNALVAEVVATHGRLDILVSAAGISVMAPVEDTCDDDFDRLVAVNFAGVFYAMRAALRVMGEQGSGAIINVASNGGGSPTASLAVYSATKAAVVAMSKAAAIEWASRGVRINSLSPGTMITGMTTGMGPEELKILDTLQPIGRASDPMEVAQGALFLASDAASYVTGHDLIIDGGATAGRKSVF